MYDVQLERKRRMISKRCKISRIIIYLTAFCVVLYIYVCIYMSNGSRIKSSDGSQDTYLKKDMAGINKGSIHSSSSPLTLWSTDFHISPIADIKHLMKGFNVTVIDKSLSGHCDLTKTCATDLKVINKDNGISLNPCPNALRREFYDAYKQNEEFQAVDAVVCNHAASLCELYMPLKKPMIIIASTRYEIGRFDADSWNRWNRNLGEIASKPYNIIAANSVYDLEYIKYFTSLQNVTLLPNFCDYVAAKYTPRRDEILIGPSRGINSQLLNQLRSVFATVNAASRRSSIDSSSGRSSGSNSSSSSSNSSGIFKPLVVSLIRELYPSHYEYSDLASHQAIVLLPYQVSVMSLFEYYRMEIPMFVPSPALLTGWHLSLGVLNERTWATVHGQPRHESALPRHPDSKCSLHSDPNNEFDRDAVLEWLKLSDFYIWPNITQFDSFEDLHQKLTRPQSFFNRISQAMSVFNAQEEKTIKAKWATILSKLRTFRSGSALEGDKGDIDGIRPNTVSGSEMNKTSSPIDNKGTGKKDTIDDALRREYGITLSETDICNGQKTETLWGFDVY